MTAISALLSKDWIACASDSLLTEFNPTTGTISHVEFRKSKIIPIRKFKAAASYWGLAKIGDWRTYDFLKSLAADAERFNSFEEFANNVRDRLKEKIDKIKFSNQIFKGIGIHLIGYDNISNNEIPELFLICNYTDTSYSKVGDLAISRNLYKTIPNILNSNDISIEEQAEKVMNILNNGEVFVFNNGDPALFNEAASAIHRMFNFAMTKKLIRHDYRAYMRLTSLPIEIIKHLQKELFPKDFRRVGGKIHNLMITRRGEFFSDTGDNNF